MKKLMKFLIAAVLMMALVPQTALAAEESYVDGDVTYTYLSYSDGEEKWAQITDIQVDESVTEPMELVIPARFGEYVVTAMGGLAESCYDKISKIS